MGIANNDYNSSDNIKIGEGSDPDKMWAKWAVEQVKAVHVTISERGMVNCNKFAKEILGAEPG